MKVFFTGFSLSNFLINQHPGISKSTAERNDEILPLGRLILREKLLFNDQQKNLRSLKGSEWIARKDRE